MRKIAKYFFCQCKRIRQLAPFLIGLTLFITLFLMLLAMNMQTAEENSELKAKIKIGFTGDVADNYLRAGLTALQRLDSIRYAIEIEEMTEQEAEKKLAAGELSAYVVFPENFVENFDRGQNVQILYATSNDGAAVGTVFMNELVDTVEKVVRESRDGIMGTWGLTEAYSLATPQETDKLTDELMFRYVSLCINRTMFYDLYCYGWGDRLSMTGYYFTAFLILYLLLWGITCSPLFVQRSRVSFCVLETRGIKIPAQVVAEYLAYYLSMMFNLFLTALPIEAVFHLTGIQLKEWGEASVAGLLLFLCRMAPVVAVISALQFWLYELISDMISGILLQFVAGVGLGYLSGCIYPVSFFPDKLQKLSEILPTGISLQYAQKCLKGEPVYGTLAILLLFTGGFLVLAVYRRKRRNL